MSEVVTVPRSEDDSELMEGMIESNFERKDELEVVVGIMSSIADPYPAELV